MTKAEASEYIKAHCNPDYPRSKTEWNTAINMAIDALGESAQKWIPVTDHLPDEDVPVLVTDDAGGMTTLGVDSCGRYEDTGERFWYTSQNVTAWMPGPACYQSKEK